MKPLSPCLLVLVVMASCGQAQEAPEAARVRDLVAADRLDEALALARDWTLSRPSELEGLTIYARLQTQMGQYQGAVDSLDSAWFLTRDPQMLVDKGLVCLEWGRPADAAQAFREALRHNDSCAPAHAGLARMMLEAGDHAEALI